MSINISEKKNKKRSKYRSKSLDDKQIQSKIVSKIKTRIRLAKSAKPTIKKFCNFLQDNNIFDSENYYKYLDTNEVFNLPRYIIRTFPDFCWRMVDPDKDLYYEKDECIEKLKEIRKDCEDEIDEMDDNEDRLDFIHKKDIKIPNRNLVKYYGGEDTDFLFFN